MDYAIIMAGGSGTRLWPLSRQGMPKQLLPLIDGKSLLQLAYERAVTVVDSSCVLVCAGRSYADVIAQQLPGLLTQNILSEPVGRDSLAALAWSAATLAERDPEAVMAVLSADHVITPQSEFTSTMDRAMSAARDDRQALVTFGVIPLGPHTGYGYLHVGAPVDEAGQVVHVTQFAEKPDLELAQSYLADGSWWWNSGMFCFRAATFVEQVRLFQPQIAQGVDRIVATPDLIDEIYPTLTRISVDYAIMEPVSHGLSSAHILAVPLRADWADIGSFPVLARYLGQGRDNAVEGRVVTVDSRDNLIVNRSANRLVAVSGLNKMIVVEDENVTLVCPFSHAETIKQLAGLASEEGAEYV